MSLIKIRRLKGLINILRYLMFIFVAGSTTVWVTLENEFIGGGGLIQPEKMAIKMKFKKFNLLFKVVGVLLKNEYLWGATPVIKNYHHIMSKFESKMTDKIDTTIWSVMLVLCLSGLNLMEGKLNKEQWQGSLQNHITSVIVPCNLVLY